MEKQVFFDFKPHFNLRSRKNDTPTSVYMVFRVNNKQYKINIGAKIYPKQWNKGQIISVTKIDIYNNNILIDKINSYKLQFEQFKNYLCNRTLNNIDIEQVISKFFNYKSRPMEEQKIKSEKCLTLLLNEIIDHGDNREKSKSQYYTIVSNFKQFITEKNIANSLESATLQTLQQYQSYLLNNKRLGRATINNRTTILKGLLNKLSQTKDTIDISSINKICKLKISKGVNNNKFVVLPIEDINKIIHTNIDNKGKEFTDSEKLVKDIFVLECLSGQRIEDILDLLQNRDKIEIKNINGNNFIEHLCNKTSTNCLIPLDLFSIDTQSILDRIYDNKELNILLTFAEKSFTQRIDRNIKVIFKRLGYTDTVKWKEQNKDNELIDKQDYFYNRISTHGGRRSFVTNCAKMGLNDNIIMLFTGHKGLEMLNQYKKLNANDKMNIAANAINKIHGISEKNNTPNSTTAKTNSNTKTYTENELLEESKKVLAYLGASGVEIEDIKKWDEAERIIYVDYEYKLVQMGLSANQIKEIFNSDRPTLKTKREALLALIEDIKRKNNNNTDSIPQ